MAHLSEQSPPRWHVSPVQRTGRLYGRIRMEVTGFAWQNQRTVIGCRYKGALCFSVVQGMWEAAENSGCEPHITVGPKNRVHRLREMMEGRAGPKAWSQP